jgi:hypothetical protein
MKTTAIIFSKDRTLQLKSLLLSLRTKTDLPEEAINIIYKNTIPEISYRPLIDEFKCQFIEQDIFLDDVKKIVSKSSSEYFLFMVDDLIFRDKASLERVERIMEEHANIDSFCFRMGKNIQSLPQPEFEKIEENIVAWDTKRDLGKHWNYFWDLSSSLYHRKLVEKYLTKCRLDKETFPNPFEDHFYQCMPNTKPTSAHIAAVNAARFALKRKSAKIACFETSRCMTQGVNLVADIPDDSREETFSPLELHSKMLEGFIVAHDNLPPPNQPNAGTRFFRLEKSPDTMMRKK